VCQMASVMAELPVSYTGGVDSRSPCLTSLPLDRPIPAYVLGHRRHAFSSGPEDPLAFVSTPRMMRRGAISYEESDVTARYIRFLGKIVSP